MADDTASPPSPERSAAQCDPSSTSYWFDERDTAVTVLQAVREVQEAGREMRRRMSTGMSMNTTDLEAVRHAIAHERAGDPLTPKALSRHLGISGASTSKLIDRLTLSGHLVRADHPRDRRSVVVLATDHAHDQVRERLSDMHDRMLTVARSVPEDSRADTAEFLQAMAECLRAEPAPR
ncbi:MarR family winged helix-turn-helix transcriptional regulator [Brachybacterium sp. P6-10-X1]|uniref:MarR family winged helix-turn-helix transcriptional regulator n=1 Tax=Brachybacterium sp. P6-10-X1 TaxID=1903186 RepID=UPI0020A604EA|nr:MarR family transcriptional regulator [Brachybacterium sp. P6-10-X1]